MDEVAGTDTVGGDKDLRVKAGTEEIDGDDGRAFGFSSETKGLAQQHLESLERGM